MVLPGTAETSPEKKITQVFEEKMKQEQTLTVARVNPRLLWAICDRLILPNIYMYVYRAGFPNVRDVKCINVTSKLGPPGATYSSQKV